MDWDDELLMEQVDGGVLRKSTCESRPVALTVGLKLEFGKSLLQFPLDRLNVLPLESGAPMLSRLISGSSAFRTWTFETRDDGTLFAGAWESSPGKWRIEYDEWVFCTLLSGVSVVCPDDGQACRLIAGDSFVIRPGFKGTWEALETTRKLFVVKA